MSYLESIEEKALGLGYPNYPKDKIIFTREEFDKFKKAFDDVTLAFWSPCPQNMSWCRKWKLELLTDAQRNVKELEATI
jgi:hypothetical protein